MRTSCSTTGAGWSVSLQCALLLMTSIGAGSSAIEFCETITVVNQLVCLCYMSLDVNLLCIAMCGVLFAFITALLS
jgi:hypothetical protein